MSYLEAEIFLDNKINLIADKLFYFLKQNFTTPLKVDDEFCISGTVANILQNQTEFDATNIIFVCSNIEMYDYLTIHIEKIVANAKIIKFKERILIEIYDYKIEIWKFNKPLDVVEYLDTEIFSQNTNQIPKFFI